MMHGVANNTTSGNSTTTSNNNNNNTNLKNKSTNMIQQELNSTQAAFKQEPINFSIKLKDANSVLYSEQHQRKLEMLESRFVPLNPQKSVSQDFSNQSVTSDEQKADLHLSIEHSNTPEKIFNIANNTATPTQQQSQQYNQQIQSSNNVNHSNNSNKGDALQPIVSGSATKERKRKRKIDSNTNNSNNNINTNNNPTSAQLQTISNTVNGEISSLNKNFKWDYQQTNVNTNQQQHTLVSSNVKKQLVNSSPGKPFASQQQLQQNGPHSSAFNQTNNNNNNNNNQMTTSLTNMALNSNLSVVNQQQNHNSHSQSPLHFTDRKSVV